MNSLILLLLLLLLIQLFEVIHTINSGQADLIINDEENSFNLFLEAYKSSENDRILNEKIVSNYNQLKWFSLGSPHLVAAPMNTGVGNNNNKKKFDLNSKGFSIFAEMLNQQDKRLFVNEIKKQYKIDVNENQIKNLIPSLFECQLNFKCFYDIYHLDGRASSAEFKGFPIRIEFNFTNTYEKACMERLIGEDFNFHFNCCLSFKKTTNNNVLSQFKKSFILESNRFKNVSFNFKLLEKIGLMDSSSSSSTSLELSNLVVNTKTSAPSFKEVITLTGHYEGILCLAVLKDGSLASGSDDTTIRIWDQNTGGLKQKLKHSSYVLCMTVVQDGKLVSGTHDGTIKIWEPITGTDFATLTGHKGYITSLVGLLNNGLASGSYDNTIKIWNLTTLSLIRTLIGHQSEIKSLAFYSTNILISIGNWNDNLIRMWNIETGEIIRNITDAQKSSTNNLIVLNNTQSLVSTGGPGDTRIIQWSLTNGSIVHITNLSFPLQLRQQQQHDIYSFAILNDGNYVTGSSDSIIRIWDFKTGELIKQLTGHTWIVTSLTVLKNGYLASGSLDRTIKIWETS